MRALISKVLTNQMFASLNQPMPRHVFERGDTAVHVENCPGCLEFVRRINAMPYTPTHRSKGE